MSNVYREIPPKNPHKGDILIRRSHCHNGIMYEDLFRYDGVDWLLIEEGGDEMKVFGYELLKMIYEGKVKEGQLFDVVIDDCHEDVEWDGSNLCFSPERPDNSCLLQCYTDKELCEAVFTFVKTGITKLDCAYESDYTKEEICDKLDEVIDKLNSMEE